MHSIFTTQKKVLVFAAHPDDELLGLGGTIHHLSQKGINCRTVILGEGMTSRSQTRDSKNWEEELKQHKENMTKAVSKLGYKSYCAYDFPDNRFDSVDLLDIIKCVEAEIHTFQPDIVFTHHPEDLNIDHRITAQSVMTSLRPTPTSKPVSLFAFETLSSTEWQLAEGGYSFCPNFFFALDEVDLKAKKEALLCYSSECASFPHPRSEQGIEVLAKYRGMQSGSFLAEGFRLLRSVQRDRQS